MAYRVMNGNGIIESATHYTNYLGFRLDRVETIGVVAHDAGDAGGSEQAQVRGMIHRPADDLQVVSFGFGDHSGRDEIATNDELASANFESFFDRLVDLAVTQKSRHERRLDAADGGHEC